MLKSYDSVRLLQNPVMFCRVVDIKTVTVLKCRKFTYIIVFINIDIIGDVTDMFVMGIVYVYHFCLEK